MDPYQGAIFLHVVIFCQHKMYDLSEITLVQPHSPSVSLQQDC